MKAKLSDMNRHGRNAFCSFVSKSTFFFGRFLLVHWNWCAPNDAARFAATVIISLFKILEFVESKLRCNQSRVKISIGMRFGTTLEKLNFQFQSIVATNLISPSTIRCCYDDGLNNPRSFHQTSDKINLIRYKLKPS